jgi:hypothetical protein
VAGRFGNTDSNNIKNIKNQVKHHSSYDIDKHNNTNKATILTVDYDKQSNQKRSVYNAVGAWSLSSS